MRNMLISMPGVVALMGLFAAGSASAFTAPGTGLARAGAERSAASPVALVCREVCGEGYCRRRCVEEPDNYGFVERRRVYRYYDDDTPRVYRRERYYDGAPRVYRERRDYTPGVQFHFGID